GEEDPVVVVADVATPGVLNTDHAKRTLALPLVIRDAIEHHAVPAVSKTWAAVKRRIARDERSRAEELKRLHRKGKTRDDIKPFAWEVMPKAYAITSEDNKYPAKARQIMYTARRLILPLRGGRFCKNSSTFTQGYDPDYLEEHPEETADWQVVFDARGHFTEPHTGLRIDLGTLPVRAYIRRWASKVVTSLTDAVAFPLNRFTCGPMNRYRFVLFTEKEGFDELMEAAAISRRYDVGNMSTKGMSVTACRELVDALSGLGIIVLVLHDFDKSGLGILYTIQTNSRRYCFKNRPKVGDMGLRLDATVSPQISDLDSEVVHYRVGRAKKVLKDPRIRLREYGATDEECNFLVRKQVGLGWEGERIELNAMISPQYLAYLEHGLQRFGVQKVIPDEEVLAMTYRHEYLVAEVMDALAPIVKRLDEKQVGIPNDLKGRVEKIILGTTTPWDDAIREIARRNACRKR